MTEAKDSEAQRRSAGHQHMQTGWIHFLRDIEPERPRLFRYCRKLTGNVWDAEDLVQDTMLKAFASLALFDDGPIRWGPYMARIASNLWIDRFRRNQPIPLDDVAEPSVSPTARSGADIADIADGGRTLLTQLSPQERCAIVMKDVFEYSLAETADLLETSEGAIKSALHRARGKLANPPLTRRPAPSEALVQRFVDAFNAADIHAIKDTMLESTGVEIFALGVSHGLENLTKRNGWVRVCLEGHEPDPTRHQRAETHVYEGEPIVLLWRHFGDGNEKLEEVWRFQEQAGRIAHIWDYCACPETLVEVAEALGRPVVTRSYSDYYGGAEEA